MNWKCVLFGLIALYCLCIIVYNIMTLVRDAKSVKQGTLHQKSRLFGKSNSMDNKKGDINCKQKFMALYTSYIKWYSKWFGTDT